MDFALTFVVAGRIQDKIGPFYCSLAGGILVSLGFFLCSFTSSLTYLFICFGVIGGLGNGFGYATPIPVMAKWFPDKRGLAVGLAVGGYGAGSAIFGPLSQLILIPSYGLSATFQVLGVIFLVMTLTGAFLLKNPPAGYKPAGWTPAAASKSAATTHEFSPGEVLATPTFYLMWVAYALGCSAGLMVISQLVPFAKSVGVAAGALSIMTMVVGACGSASGRILSGWMSDKVGRINVLRIMIAVSMVTMPLLYAAGSSIAPLYVAVFIVYWCYGTQLSVNGSATADFWGTKNAWMWYRENIGRNRCPIVDTWWQTETGMIMIAPLPGATPLKPGSATRPLPGVVADVVTREGEPVPPNGGGFLVLKQPWPAMLRTIYGDPQRYEDQYWSQIPGMYFTGDGARKDADGYFWIMGRIDDVINVSGHRLSTMEVESALVAHHKVAEAAVVARLDDIKGQAIAAFVTLKAGNSPGQELKEELRQWVAKEIGSLAKPDDIRFTDALPKTRSGKIMRRLLKEIAAGGEVKGDTTTLEDLSVVTRLSAHEE